MNNKFTAVCSLIVGCVCSPFAYAQTTGAVFGPGVTAGHQSVELRTAYATSDSRRRDGTAARLHYQRSIDDKLRWRLILQGSDLSDGSFERDFLQAELQWNFRKPTATSHWSHGLRADYRLTDNDNGTDQIGLNYTVQNTFAPRWQVTGVVLASYQVGGGAADGTALELRGSVSHRLNNGLKVALESFNALGRTGNNGDFNDQNHRLGPSISGKLAANYGFYVGALFGASDAARHADYRAWISRSF